MPLAVDVSVGRFEVDVTCAVAHPKAATSLSPAGSALLALRPHKQVNVLVISDLVHVGDLCWELLSSARSGHLTEGGVHAFSREHIYSNHASYCHRLLEQQQ